MAETVTACVIATNEQARLGETLERLSFCDELLVVDGGSTDDTVAIAKAAGAKVIENAWPGFAAQRNVAIDAAESDWILEIDADERVTPQLRDEINSFLAGKDAARYDMGALPMRHWFLGKLLGASARYPNYRYRLFRRDAYRHDESRTVHEGLWANDRVWVFESDIEHLLADSIGEALRDARSYARLEASGLPGAGLRGFLVGVVIRPVAKFGYRTVVVGGWRDGLRGMLKIAIECWSDIYVWALRTRKDRAQGQGGHFGQSAPNQGSLRIIGVGTGDGAGPVLAWLRSAADAGCDVALVTEMATPQADVHVRRLSKPSTFAVASALATENALRPYDAVLSDDGRPARNALRYFKQVRGHSTPATLSEPVSDAIARIKRQSRGPTN